jgi:Protein of unknown function (DUF3445)
MLLNSSLFDPSKFPLDLKQGVDLLRPRTDEIRATKTWHGLGLPKPSVLFPVDVPFRIAADLTKYLGAACLTDQTCGDYLYRKLEALALQSDSMLLPEEPVAAGVWEEIWSILGLNSAVFSKALGLGEVGDFWQQLSPLDRQRAFAQRLTLVMQEDWVLLDAQGVFVAGSVCFPSGWAPFSKFGQGLHQIHRPVADGDALRKASAALTRAMLEKGPFRRLVWTLSPSAALSRHPGAPIASPEALHFRCEQQTTLALPKTRHALFLIRVQVTPLEESLAGGGLGSRDRPPTALRAERLARLQAALLSMSDAVLDYKGLRDIRPQVLAML